MEGICITHSCIPLNTVYLQKIIINLTVVECIPILRIKVLLLTYLIPGLETGSRAQVVYVVDD